MTTVKDSRHYQMGVELAEAGKYQEALGCIREHLRTVPADVQALNDMGAILHCLGRSDEAVQQLAKAWSLDTDSAEIVWNLAEAYLAAARAREAALLLDDMERLKVLNPDVVNRMATMLLDQNDKANAAEVLLRSLRLWPQQVVLQPILDVIRSKRPKVAFFGRSAEGERFVEKVYEFAAERFETKRFEGAGITQAQELMRGSDICWFDCCDGLTVEASKLPKICKSVVCVHCCEEAAELLKHIQWENVDMLVTVGSSFVEQIVLRLVPDIHHRTRVVNISQAVDLDRFRFVGRPRGKNLVCMDRLDARSNPMFLLQCMQKLHYIDSGYKMFFAGGFYQAVLEQYLRHITDALELNDVVFFCAQQGDLECWLQDKHYVVSAGTGGGQGTEVLEAMACGLKPVVHNFPGAGEIFQPEFIFNISEQFCEQILSDRYEPARYRRFVEERYPLRRQLKRVNEIFVQLEVEIDLRRAGGAHNDCGGWAAGVPGAALKSR